MLKCVNKALFLGFLAVVLSSCFDKKEDSVPPAPAVPAPGLTPNTPPPQDGSQIQNDTQPPPPGGPGSDIIPPPKDQGPTEGDGE